MNVDIFSNIIFFDFLFFFFISRSLKIKGFTAGVDEILFKAPLTLSAQLLSYCWPHINKLVISNFVEIDIQEIYEIVTVS